MNKVKIVIAGAGIWGNTHAKIYNEHPNAEVVGVCDLNAKKAQEMADEYGVTAVDTDLDALLSKVDCDAVSIATPDFAHTDLALTAAAHKKHMLIEKPIATSREDTFAIMEAVEKAGVRAMVDLHNRWSPPFNAAWQAIQNGQLGELQSAYFRLNDNRWVATDMLPWAAKSSILWFLGSHSLDTLRWLFNDDVTRVYSVCRDGVLKKAGVDTVDIYQTTLEFSKGGIAHMENGWITPNANPCVNDIKCNLTGDIGSIEINASDHNLIRMYTDNTAVVPDVLVQNSIFDKVKGFSYESIRDFVDSIIEEREFRVSLRDAANTTLAILAIMESAEKREPVIVDYNR